MNALLRRGHRFFTTNLPYKALSVLIALALMSPADAASDWSTLGAAPLTTPLSNGTPSALHDMDWETALSRVVFADPTCSQDFFDTKVRMS